MRSKHRLLMSVSALVIAVLLHTKLCDWTMDSVYVDERDILVVTFQGTTTIGGRTLQRTHVRGIVAEKGASLGEAVMYGIAVPLGLVVFSIMAMSNWRATARREKGRCPDCGYDLQHQFDDGCPECGWRRT